MENDDLVTLSSLMFLRQSEGLIGEEILSIIIRGLKSLELLVENAKTSSVKDMSISPDGIYLFSDGTVQMMPVLFSTLDVKFKPPECDDKSDSTNKAGLNLEKMYIFSLGSTLTFAMEQGKLKEGALASMSDVYSLLNLMTARNPDVRFNLSTVAQMSEKLVQKYSVNPSITVQALFNSAKRKDNAASDWIPTSEIHDVDRFVELTSNNSIISTVQRLSDNFESETVDPEDAIKFIVPNDSFDSAQRPFEDIAPTFAPYGTSSSSSSISSDGAYLSNDIAIKMAVNLSPVQLPLLSSRLAENDKGIWIKTENFGSSDVSKIDRSDVYKTVEDVGYRSPEKIETLSVASSDHSNSFKDSDSKLPFVDQLVYSALDSCFNTSCDEHEDKVVKSDDCEVLDLHQVEPTYIDHVSAPLPLIDKDVTIPIAKTGNVPILDYKCADDESIDEDLMDINKVAENLDSLDPSVETKENLIISMQVDSNVKLVDGTENESERQVSTNVALPPISEALSEKSKNLTNSHMLTKTDGCLVTEISKELESHYRNDILGETRETFNSPNWSKFDDLLNNEEVSDNTQTLEFNLEPWSNDNRHVNDLTKMNRSTLLSPFDNVDDSLFTTPSTFCHSEKVFSQTDRVLEELMPITSSDFSQPKQHSEATHRKHHSAQCAFCDPKPCTHINDLINKSTLDNFVRQKSADRSSKKFLQRRSHSLPSPDLLINTSSQNNRYSDGWLFDSTLVSLHVDAKNDNRRSPQFPVHRRNETPLFDDFDDLPVVSKKPSDTPSKLRSYETLNACGPLSVQVDKKPQQEEVNVVSLQTIPENDTADHSASSTSSSSFDRNNSVQKQLTYDDDNNRNFGEKCLGSPTLVFAALKKDFDYETSRENIIPSSPPHPPPRRSVRRCRVATQHAEPLKAFPQLLTEQPCPRTSNVDQSEKPCSSTTPASGCLSRANSMRLKTGSSVRSIQRRASNVSNSNNLKKDLPLPQPTLSNNRNPQTVAQMLAGNSGPEFLFNSRQPSIRLKAPLSLRQKKLFTPVIEKNILVILLNGQRMDVACRVDSIAENIFESVSAHTNLNERHFFGLTVLRDGEHFFLEPEQKIEKFAPPGWRTHNKHVLNARIIFTLFLRVKFYPILLDFVKTEQTLHNIYLQLRRDILDERLICDKTTACRLAALALQAEYGHCHSNSADQFSMNHYMPDIHFLDEIEAQDIIKRQILDFRASFIDISSKEAEIQYVKLCQSLREYGIHFHRLYRTKPSLLLTPSPLGDPDTGTPLWIGIMPRGVIIFEEKNSERVPVSQHPWHSTATLQFDHKRFIIFPQADNSNGSVKYVYYSDDYRKSMYFVHFAAAQHKFCMKMRAWAATMPVDHANSSSLADTPNLKRVSNGTDSDFKNGSINETDSGISRENSPDDINLPSISSSSRIQANFIMAPSFGSRHRERAIDPLPSTALFNTSMSQFNTTSVSTPVPESKRASLHLSSQPNHSIEKNQNIDASNFPSLLLTNNKNGSSIENLEKAACSPASAVSSSGSNGEFEIFSVTMHKDHHVGLGLTLVDGEIDKIEGVYVRSITPGGPAQIEGNLRVADRVVSINGVSLDAKNRHDAVDLVRRSGDQVTMGILRLRSVYSSSESIENRSNSVNISNELQRKIQLDYDDDENAKKPNYSSNQSPLPPILNVDAGTVWMNDASSSGGVSFQNRSGRPPSSVVNPTDVSNNNNNIYSGLHRSSFSSSSSHESDSEDSRLGDKTVSDINKPIQINFNDGRKVRTRKYSRNSKSSVAELNDELRRMKAKTDGKRISESSTSGKSLSMSDLAQNVDKSDLAPISNKDWTEDLNLSDRISDSELNNNFRLVNVYLPKNSKGSLGIQIAGGKGQRKVYIKALLDEPAISNKNMQPGDQLVSVNEVSTRGLSHEQIIWLIKNAKSPVHLGLLRTKDNDNASDSSRVEEPQTETLDVLLEKPALGSLGLSLAKPPNTDGIFIRVIAPGSVASLDGRLKIGDRLWMINGDCVAQCNPTEVVEKLKAAQGFVKLVVKRCKVIENVQKNNTVTSISSG